MLRELLSLTLAHSKSTVPAPLLDNRVAFRRLAQQAVLTDLETHRATDGLPDPRDSQPLALTANTRRYASAADQSYAWLVSGEREQRSLADDVVDALRVLRVADALRQRGTSLRTTGGYEIFIDAATGQAVFSLRSTDNSKVYLLRGDSPKSAGEANLRAAAVTADGHLRIAFHRGAYLEPAAERSAAESTAHIVADILADVLPTFAAERLPDDLEPPSLRADKVQIQLERPGDNPEFAEDVASLVAAAHPELAHRVVTVADLEGVSPEERNRFYRGVPVAPRSGEARRILQQLARHGARIDGIDVDAAFADVRRVRVAAGEVLASIGSSSVFVYVATGTGLKVQPAGGYPPASIDPWIPVGTTGVIRRAERNGEVTAERDVEILMIPGDCYVRVWFRPYGAGQLADALAHALDATNGG